MVKCWKWNMLEIYGTMLEFGIKKSICILIKYLSKHLKNGLLLWYFRPVLLLELFAIVCLVTDLLL